MEQQIVKNGIMEWVRKHPEVFSYEQAEQIGNALHSVKSKKNTTITSWMRFKGKYAQSPSYARQWFWDNIVRDYYRTEYINSTETST